MKVPLSDSCHSGLVEDIMPCALEYLEGFHTSLCRYFGLKKNGASPTIFSCNLWIDRGRITGCVRTGQDSGTGMGGSQVGGRGWIFIEVGVDAGKKVGGSWCRQCGWGERVSVSGAGEVEVRIGSEVTSALPEEVSIREISRAKSED